MYRKNVAGQYLYFALVNATTGAALTGATVTGKRGIDGAAQASVTGTISEEAGGQYKIALSQADINGNNIGYLFTATNAIPINITIVTTAADPTDAVHFGLSALPNTACTTNASLLTSGTGTDQLSVTSGRVDTGKISGTSQTARDLGASVLLSSGTGTGQLSLSSGLVTLTPSEHIGVAADVQFGLTSQGYTTTRAPYLDTLNGLVAAIWASATRTLSAFSFSVVIAGDLSSTMKTSVETAVWNATASSHTTAGTTGALLNSAAPATDTAAIKAKTDSLTFTVAGMADANVTDWKGATAPAMTGDAYARLGAPAGASVSADVAAVKVDTAAIEATVWNATAASHNTAGTTGNKLNSAASAGDPWSTALPGSYAAGSAGAILGALNGAIAAIWAYGTRTLSAFGFTVATNSDANVTAIKAKTDPLTFTTPNRVDATVVSGNPNTYQQQGSGDSPYLGR